MFFSDKIELYSPSKKALFTCMNISVCIHFLEIETLLPFFLEFIKKVFNNIRKIIELFLHFGKVRILRNAACGNTINVKIIWFPFHFVQFSCSLKNDIFLEYKFICLLTRTNVHRVHCWIDYILLILSCLVKWNIPYCLPGALFSKLTDWKMNSFIISWLFGNFILSDANIR